MLKVYYHCVVKVCELDQATECAFYKLNSDGGKYSYFITSYIITSQVMTLTFSLNTILATVCDAQEYAAPAASRKRRSLGQTQKASVSAGIQVQPISAAECSNLSEDSSICYGN